MKPSEESVPRRKPRTITNATKRSRGAMTFDNMEPLVTLTRAVFTRVMGTDTVLQGVEGGEKLKQTRDGI